MTRVCLHLTPASPFPSQDYSSYEAYYRQKYKLSIMSKGQPLLEVKAISNKINCLRPRYHIASFFQLYFVSYES